MDPLLRVTSLCRTFAGRGGRRFVAVENVSFSLRRGEILGVLGPNGAGKTTTIQMLLGVLRPTSGSIVYFGKELWSHRSEILERINFSSSYTSLPLNLRVKDVFTYMPLLYSRPNRRERVAELTEILDLKRHWNLEIHKLSSGELTRLNLAKALLNQPEILLLDEPTASLDPASAHLVRDLILKLQQSQGLAVVLTSHNMAEVEALCERIVFINKGRVVAFDTPSCLSARLDRYTVKFCIAEPGLSTPSDLMARFSSLGLTGNECQGQYTFQLTEAEVKRLIQFLGQEQIPFQGLSVERADLEDFFLAEAATLQRSTAW